MFVLSSIFHLLHIDMCQSISGLFFFVECSVFVFLRFRQWLIKHLQFQSPFHIWAIAKPEYQLITGFNALVAHTCFVIQISQLIGPFFGVFLFLQFLKDGNQFFVRSPLRFLDIITEHVFQAVPRSNLHKFLIVIFCTFVITHLDCDFCKTIDDHTTNRRTVICQQQYFPAVLVPFCLLVNFSGFHQSVYILYFVPVYCICNIRCIFILLFCIKRLHLIQFQIVFIFIH